MSQLKPVRLGMSGLPQLADGPQHTCALERCVVGGLLSTLIRPPGGRYGGASRWVHFYINRTAGSPGGSAAVKVGL